MAVWLVTYSCGRGREASSEWAAHAVSRLHQRLTGPAKVVKPGTITISARKLMEIVKELPAAPLALTVQENAWVALRCAGASYRLVGLTPEEFPAQPGGRFTTHDFFSRVAAPCKRTSHRDRLKQ